MVKTVKLIKIIKQLDDNDLVVLIIVANNALKNKQARNSKE